jgi:hypothetical protein
MVADRDCFEDLDGDGKAWFVNAAHAIGKPLAKELLARYKAALLDGDDKPLRQ